MVAVGLGVLGFQVAVGVGQHFPQVQEITALLHRQGGQVVVDPDEPGPIHPAVARAGADLGPHRRDGLDVDIRVGQQRPDVVQHQAVIIQKAGVIGVLGQDVGAQQDVHRLGRIGGQSLQRHFLYAVDAGAGGPIDHRVGPYPAVGAVMGVGQAGVVDLQPLGQAVPQKDRAVKIAQVHRLRLGHRHGRQPEIHRRRAVGPGLHLQGGGVLIAEGPPGGVGQRLLQQRDLGFLPAGRGGIQLPPQHPYTAQKHQHHQRQKGRKHPAPAPVQHMTPVFLIICHEAAPPLPRRGRILLILFYCTMPAAGRQDWILTAAPFSPGGFYVILLC